MRTNRKCYCCSTEYYYCSTCEEQRHLETWHIMFHEENCKKIFQICRDDFLKHTTREETIKLLEDCDLSHLEKLNIEIVEQINEILASKIETTKINQPTEDPVVNTYYKNKKKK